MVNLKLENNEFEELYELTRSILLDNTPDGEDYDGKDLVERCLLHNDPENFQERNKAFNDSMNQFSSMCGTVFVGGQETHKDVEDVKKQAIAEWYVVETWEDLVNDEDFCDSVLDDEVPLFDWHGNHIGYGIPSHYQSITNIIL